MSYKLVPITTAPYVDSHIHSVNHGAGLMQNYSNANIHKLVDVCAAVGLTTICVSDHIPFPTGIIDPAPDQDCAIARNLYETVWEKVSELKQYAQTKGVNLLWSGEYDVFPNTVMPDYKTDWKVLGQHFIDEVDGQPWCFDLSAESFAAGVKERGIQTVVKRYFELLQSALTQNQFDSVAHLDLITKYNGNNIYFTEDDTYHNFVIRTLQVMKQRDVALEINLGGCLATGHLVPQPWIIQQAIALCVSITIGSDEHAPSAIDLSIWKTIYQQLADLGVTQLAIPTLTK